MAEEDILLNDILHGWDPKHASPDGMVDWRERVPQMTCLYSSGHIQNCIFYSCCQMIMHLSFQLQSYVNFLCKKLTELSKIYF